MLKLQPKTHNICYHLLIYKYRVGLIQNDGYYFSLLYFLHYMLYFNSVIYI